MMASRRVVVTGMGALTPIGLGVSAYWDGLRNGVSGADYITHFDASRFPTQFACEVKNFDPSLHLHKRDIRRMDLFSIYAIVAAIEAIEDAQLDFNKIDKSRVAIVLGSGIGGLKTFEDEMKKYFVENLSQCLPEGQAPKGPRFSPFFIPKMIIDIAAGHISMRYGITGPNYACVSACSTSANCIADAWMLIKTGMADVVITGGSEAAVTESGVGGFNAMKALSTRNDDPKTASRPFDKDRDGFVLGEGSGVLILEAYEHAVERGAKIYAELSGVGLTADAYHLTAPHPDGAGAAAVMRKAIESAGKQPQDVDYINLHGTSTPLGDVAETKAIKKVFGEHAYKLSLSSTKSMTGHLLGAAGAIEAIATVLAIHHQTIPPTINHFTDDPECDLDYTFNKARSKPIKVALSNTFGFGGHNVCLLFEKVE